MQWTFVYSSYSLLYCVVWSMPECQSSYVHIELSTYLNVMHMVFILYAWLGLEKLALSAKFILLMDMLQLHYTPSHGLSSYRWSSMRFHMTNFWASITLSHVRLLIGLSLVWYGILWLLLCLIALPSHSARHVLHSYDNTYNYLNVLLEYIYNGHISSFLDILLE